MPKLLTRSHLLIFVFISITLGYRPYVLFYEFYGVMSYIQVLCHFDFIFVYGVKECSKFIDFTYGYPAFPMPLADKTAFFHYVFLLLLLKILSISPENMKAIMQKKKKKKTRACQCSQQHYLQLPRQGKQPKCSFMDE